MLQVEIDGISIAYERSGDGPPIVLLHGFTHDSRVWRRQVEALSAGFTVVAWDAPGAGQSGDPPPTFGIGDWAQCLAGLLASIGVARAHVVGLSWGGLLAQEFYRRYPASIISLTLADTYAGWKGSLGEEVAEERLAACLRDSSLPPGEFVPRYLPGMFSPAVVPQVRSELAEITAGFHPLGFGLMARALAETDTRDLLPQIRVPTLLIWGDADVRSPLEVGEQMCAAIPVARLAVIPNTGHVSNMEAADGFNHLVQEFCSSIGGG